MANSLPMPIAYACKSVLSGKGNIGGGGGGVGSTAPRYFLSSLGSFVLHSYIPVTLVVVAMHFGHCPGPTYNNYCFLCFITEIRILLLCMQEASRTYGILPWKLPHQYLSIVQKLAMI